MTESAQLMRASLEAEMNRESTHTYVTGMVALLGALGLLATSLANAQVPVDDEGNPVGSVGSADYPATGTDAEGPLLSAAELETLVGPVALYPDDLLAIVLPASTYPLEIVQAARFLERHEDDPALTPDEDWDASIIALLNYPEVVNMMNDDLDWTWKLGEAVVAQQSDLIAAVEAFRDRAYAAGNLKTDDHQTVSNNDGIIEIEPVSDDVIYVPYYEPERVVVYSPRPAYYYYPRPYPVYYYPYGPGYDFGSGFFWGVTTAFTIGWASDYLHVYHHSYYGHPYFGSTYYGNHYWRNPSIYLYNNYYVNNHHHHRGSGDHYRDGDYWRPRHHGGARPGHRSAHNTYYSGSHRENRRDRSFRDDRTSGLAFNNRGGSSHSSRGEHRRSNRHGTGSPTVQFRPRGGNAFTGTIAPRLERAPDDSSRRSRHRSDNDHRSDSNHGSDSRSDSRSGHGRHGSRNRNDDSIRFRARESGASPSDVNRRTVARQTRRPDRSNRSATVSQRRRTSLAANNSSRSVRNTTHRPSSASRATNVRRTARASSPPRQAAVRSQPRRESQARPARPRQARRADSSRHGSSSRPSSERKSVARSDEPKRSSKGSQGRKRSGRGRR